MKRGRDSQRHEKDVGGDQAAGLSGSTLFGFGNPHRCAGLTFAEKLSSRFVCRRFRIAGSSSVKELPRSLLKKSIWGSVTSAFSIAFPHLEVVYVAANKVHLVICALGPRIARVKQLKIDGILDVVGSHLLEKFHNLTCFDYGGNIDCGQFEYFGRNLTSLSMDYRLLTRILSFVPQLEELRVKVPPLMPTQERNANESALLVGLATFCIKLRKLKTKIEGASDAALDQFLTNC